MTCQLWDYRRSAALPDPRRKLATWQYQTEAAGSIASQSKTPAKRPIVGYCIMPWRRKIQYSHLSRDSVRHVGPEPPVAPLPAVSCQRRLRKEQWKWYLQKASEPKARHADDDVDGGDDDDGGAGKLLMVVMIAVLCLLVC